MPMGLWRRLATLCLGLALGVVVAAPRARAADAKLLHHKARSFRIPITVDPKHRAQMKEVRLYVSTDSGATWDLAGRMEPDEPSFTFKAPRDGEYWFAVRTVDLQNRPYPAGERATEPMLRVVVDTKPPTIDLQALSRVGTRAAVRWEMQDEADNLAPETLTLQYQLAGAADFASVPIRRAARIGQESWDTARSDRMKVRATVRDKAGNVGVAEVSLPEGTAENPSSGVETTADDPPPRLATAGRRAPALAPEPIAEPDAPAPAAAEPAPPPTAARPSSTLLVGSPRFPLQYDVQDAGPGGAALVELWTTRDGGRTWSRQPEDADHRSPYDVDLGGEGTFGLWLVVQGASGLGDLPPAPGDRPQTWVEVDASPPTVQLDPPRPGVGASAGKLTITWRAADAHLAPQPIRIYYKPDTPDAAWQLLARLENTGKYNWTIPPRVPPRFHIKVEAVDAAGHVASADTTEIGAVTIDRARPKGRILGLDPAAKLGVGGQYRR